jgi:hypothetical protein
MTIFAKVSTPPLPRTKDTVKVSLLYAGVLVVMAVAQLFTFDGFIELVASFNLPFSETGDAVIAPLIIAFEVFAIPFLLRMRLSQAFRWLSMLCGWSVALLWAFISIWVVTTNPAVSTIGFLGTALTLIPGWWAVCISLAFGILAGWSGWGLWPGPLTFPKK